MKMKITLLIFVLLAHVSLHAQQVVESDTSGSGRPRVIRFDPKQRPLRANEAPVFLRSALKLGPEDSLRLTRRIAEDNGRSHQYFNQYYKGYPVRGGSYAVHGRDGIIESVDGELVEIGKVSVDVRVDENAALANALSDIHAAKYGWQDEAVQARYREVERDPKATLYPKGSLIIFKDERQTKSFRLAWQFHIKALEPDLDLDVFVDAATGRILAKESRMLHVNVPGTVACLYWGTRNVTMDNNTPGNYRLREVRTTNGRTANIHTFDNHGSSSATNPGFTDFNGTTTSWTTPNAGHDVHWGAEMVFDYWATVRNRNSYDNLGGTLECFAHAGNIDNAGWDPTVRRAIFGDGDVKFKPVVSIDAVAHEIAHGITQSTCALNGTLEARMLNEGLSDIWASVVESWANACCDRWEIGEYIVKDYTCLRSMRNPNLKNNPDTYGGTYWDSDPFSAAAIHTNSTVFSHWFFLLSEGGSGTNDIGNSYRVTAQTMDVAANIVWRAQQFYLNANSGYSAARTAMISAATDLYGAGSCQVKAVQDAWYAVGVGAAGPSAPLVLTGPEGFCSTATYTCTGVPSGQTVTWSVNPTGVASMSISGNSVTLTKVSAGSFTLTASLPNCVNISKEVSTIPTMRLTSTMSGSCRDGGWQDWFISASPNMPLTNYVWTSTPGGSTSQINIYSPSSSTSWVAVKGGGGVNITAKNACNQTVNDGVTVYAPCPMTLFAVSPNPAVSSVSITPKQDGNMMKAAGTERALQIQVVSVFDQMGNRVKQQKFSNTGTAQLNISGLKQGMYYIEIEYNGTKERQPLIVGQK
ncbi:Por secretion system C-terminal sorting domain-containing protein [Chitinophaga jiangningensis]|uniref:Por secretion system C-terminal sorting domain-containing protein n=1 Tax=Chitinophaga jiangningensis TaxID=1419482 RepID=A0A1M7CQL8_9BACT|nr:M4 family metallopeptidase [Chitinophaga jiangningensis]SHL69546.1 Por secretion system C-terminal sorting domain-containing protein [Chitinophaga jiangningensis]